MSNSGGTMVGARTADEVIQIFAAVGLPVTDNAASIKKKVDDQYSRHLRDKNSPDRDAAHRATLWMKGANDLTHRRPELLDLVYSKFARQADTSLQGALATGLQTLTNPLVENLRTILRDDCRADDDLTTRFLNRYLAERGLAYGGEIVKPELVRNLTAVNSGGKISLAWTLPAQKCDRVEIVRQSDANPKEKKTFSVEGSSFEDVAVSPGGWYTYKAYSIYHDAKSTGFVEARAVAIGDVRNVAPAWKDGRVSLTWDSPGPASVGVLIFRRNGGAPSVHKNTQGVKADSDTTLAYQGGGTRFADEGVVEGATYYYKIIADFGDGRFGKGVDTQITVPKPPPPPSALKAVYERSANENVVALEWKPVNGVADARYVVVRRDGESAPARVDQDTLVEQTEQTRCLDRQVEPGHRYSYAVFTRVGDFHSRTAAAARPVDVLADVTDFAAASGDGVVELQWTTPANVVDVIIKRSLNPPRSHDDTSARVKLSGKGHARDEGLHNDRQYHYLLCCVYRPGGTAEVVSPGVRIEAVPSKLPDAPADFIVGAEGREIRCGWTPPEYGQVVVLRSEGRHGLPFGHRLPADALHGLGERIAASGREAIDTAPDLSKPHYSIFTVTGSHAIAGGTTSCVVCPDVSNLNLQATREGVTLRWSWPVGCTAVRVVRRADDWPQAADDPDAISMSCTRAEFDGAGGRYVDKIRQESGRFHYVVYAQVSGAPGQFFAAGVSQDCRAVIQWEASWTTIRYRLLPDPGRSKGEYEIRLKWSVEEISPSFSGFVLLADQDEIPSSIHEGVELFRWTPGMGEKPGSHEATISLAPLRKRRWARIFAKALVIDPAQRFTTLIFHPNVCVAFSSEGKLQLQKHSASAPRVYKKGVPRKVICPGCFNEFSVGEMLFQSFNGGDMLRGKYSIFDRLLGRPPRPPIHQNGQRLTNKICPDKNCHRPLPFTAGAQASLVIGLIGAKYSGKSHYIGSLIERLSAQVGGDLESALIPVSDETSNRYQREFYNPLFKSRMQLPVTIGTPPPLIYDLRFSGRLWGESEGRAVTLALYETAGENLVSEERVREMVQYLRPASGVIFLIDPLQIDAVRQALPPTVVLPPLDADADPYEMISRVLKKLEDGKVVEHNALLSTPVAVVLAKCDVLRDGGLIDVNRAWAGDRRHIGYFSSELHEDMSGLIGEYVKRWSPAVYNIVTQSFSRHAFFGASSTGCTPDKQSGYYKYISPWRVEDPLLWLLAEVGVIPVR